MSVQARFYVSKIERFAYNPDQLNVTLQAVSRGTENKSWAAATPSGQMTLNISNESAATWFADRLGKDVAISFEDRPIICSACGAEIAQPVQHGMTGVDDGKGGVKHYECPKVA